MGKYLEAARKAFAGTTDTTKDDQRYVAGTSVVFGRIGRNR